MPYYSGDPNRNWPQGLSRTPVDYRKEEPAKFGDPNYNPEITTYYANASGTDVVRIEERIRTSDNTVSMWAQTISGSAYSQQWPNYDHSVVENEWADTTYSG